jgi:hypothetical protein
LHEYKTDHLKVKPEWEEESLKDRKIEEVQGVN